MKAIKAKERGIASTELVLLLSTLALLMLPALNSLNLNVSNTFERIAFNDVFLQAPTHGNPPQIICYGGFTEGTCTSTPPPEVIGSAEQSQNPRDHATNPQDL